MYISKHFEETRLEVLHALMRTYSFGALVTAGQGELNVNHLPFVVAPAPSPYGTLRCHVARTNPVWREFPTSIESMVMFQGPHGYISPSWYPSKKQHGKVVPTWNYAVVHAYGQPKIVEEIDWLTDLLNDLTDQHESSMASPWKISGAPKDYIDKMLGAIVGIEIPITRIYGKWKQSQNRPLADRHGVIAGLEARDEQQSSAVAELVRKTLSS